MALGSCEGFISPKANFSASSWVGLWVPAPTFSVPAGTYSSTQTVAISDATSGATIYYTTDGTTPTTSSTSANRAGTVQFH